jgi:hypothetical protein
MNPFVRPSIESDCEYIADHIRAADQRECDLWELLPKDSLSTGFRYSVQPLTVVDRNGNPAAMFGVTQAETPGFDKSSDATIWLLGTDELFTFPVEFVRQSLMWIDHICRPLAAKHGHVGNWVDERNTKHVDWLIWVGFVRTSSIIKGDVSIAYYRKAI